MNIDVRDICVQLANGPEGGIGLRKSVNIPLTAPTLGGTARLSPTRRACRF